MTEPDRRPTVDFRAYAQQLQLDLRRLVEQGPELARQARAVQATETSPDGLVSVTVGPQGRVVRLDLDPRIYRTQDAGALAALITETIEHAVWTAEDQVVALMSGVADGEQVRAMLNGDDEVVAGIVGEQLRGRR
ncbi:YbaB/EbfC family nucleoid-associated protein [Klenkia terrae]|uniref:YbaB/EbfC family nucleoid-associated protein n=1 Tax=Klenkia terrae TaxID=1052259 RepID=A0ABU8E6U4_9ACTN|nr:YbaB/EbfC family nucleoid-associated protein [Klenkia terrae]SSC24124.1 Nucleoid-associated protein YbaB/EbfC family [Klenkia terrae]